MGKYNKKIEKSLFGYHYDSIQFPHKNGPFPFVSQLRERSFCTRNDHQTGRLHFAKKAVKEKRKRERKERKDKERASMSVTEIASIGRTYDTGN